MKGGEPVGQMWPALKFDMALIQIFITQVIMSK